MSLQSRRSKRKHQPTVEGLEDRSLLAVVTPTFTTPTKPYTFGNDPKGGSPSVVFFPLNHHKLPDMVAVSNLTTGGDGNVVVRQNYGVHGFGNPRLYSTGGSGPTAIAVAYMNNDTIPDIVVVNQGVFSGGRLQGSNVSVLLGNSAGGFSAPITVANLAAGYRPVALVVADFNSDGKNDVVVADDGVFTNTGVPIQRGVTELFGDGKGNLGRGAFYGESVVGRGPDALAVTNVSHGRPGYLVVGNGGLASAGLATKQYQGEGVTVLRNNLRTGIVTKVEHDHSGGSVTSIAVGDVNGDGITDVVTAEPGTTGSRGQQIGGGVSVMLGNGKGVYRFAGKYATGTQVSSVAIADLNGDKVPDIVDTTGIFSLNFRTGHYSRHPYAQFFLGQRRGIIPSTQPHNITTGLNPTQIVAQDLNGDGKVDLSVAYYGLVGRTQITSGGVYVYLNSTRRV